MDAAMTVCYTFYPILLFLYGFLMEMTTGSTIGQLIKGLYVRGHEGIKVPASQAAVRNLIKLLGVFVLLSGSQDMLLQDKYTKSVVCNKQ